MLDAIGNVLHTVRDTVAKKIQEQRTDRTEETEGVDSTPPADGRENPVAAAVAAATQTQFSSQQGTTGRFAPGHVHTIKEGEWLSTIARDALKAQGLANPNNDQIIAAYKEIHKANYNNEKLERKFGAAIAAKDEIGANVDKIDAGQRVLIPDLSRVIYPGKQFRMSGSGHLVPKDGSDDTAREHRRNNNTGSVDRRNTNSGVAAGSSDAAQSSRERSGGTTTIINNYGSEPTELEKDLSGAYSATKDAIGVAGAMPGIVGGAVSGLLSDIGGGIVGGARAAGDKIESEAAESAEDASSFVDNAKDAGEDLNKLLNPWGDRLPGIPFI
jgi:hypothetical protein